MRTAIGQFSFSLVILKIFTAEFYAIGALFAVYGAAVLLVAIYRRYEGHRQFFTAQTSPGEGSDQSSNGRSGDVKDKSLKKRFRTSGDSVALLTILSLCAYSTLLALVWRLLP